MQFQKGRMERTKIFSLIAAALIVSAGCGHKQDNKAGGGPPPAAEVGVVTITAESVPMTTELPGRIEAVRTSEVRARATGILLKQVYKEGADVKAGDTLFEIDPAPLQANYDSAKAILAKAEANLSLVESKAKRFKELVEIHAISQQEFDEISSQAVQSKADLQSAKAAVETAELNLGYATVKAPISGRTGEAKVTEGTLVSQAQATLLAVIQQLDPIYADFTQSSADVLRLRRALDEGKLQSAKPGEAKVTLILEDGTAYQHAGKLLFTDITVDPTTGMVSLRAEFPNPNHLLLPGMFGRGHLEQAVANKAITVPQRGVILGPGGTATAMVVANNKVEARPIKISSAVGDKWIVTEGLQAGEWVIVEGLQKVRPGAEVKPVPFNPGDQTASNKPTEPVK
jgi:membrane fusion protein (multidrug efflux system)